MSFITRLRTDRRAEPRLDEPRGDRRGFVATFDGSPWVKAARENRLSPGGPMSTESERASTALPRYVR